MSKKIRVAAFSELHSDTRTVRWTDHRLSNWLTTTTCWIFEGGDACGVVTGHLGNVRCYTVLRLGDEVHVVEASFNDALAAYGLNYREFRYEDTSNPQDFSYEGDEE